MVFHAARDEDLACESQCSHTAVSAAICIKKFILQYALKNQKLNLKYVQGKIHQTYLTVRV